jgi:UTP-glucose-1-phosphate uridylyltransferase
VIIRKDIKDEFMDVIGNRIEEVCAKRGVELLYAYQELQNLPEGYSCPEDRKKPWGTGHAVLACDGMIQGPFAVLNADDYYGKSAFRLIYNFLQDYDPKEPGAFAMAGFVLKNTLSDNGEVTRGICQADENGYLTDVVETRHIVKTENGAEAEGVQLNMESLASMNFFTGE